MNTLEQTTESGADDTTVSIGSRRVDAISIDDSDFDDQLRATPFQIARWCAGWLVLGLGGWGAVITLGWLASNTFSVPIP